jgi:hypothetical protein
MCALRSRFTSGLPFAGHLEAASCTKTHHRQKEASNQKPSQDFVLKESSPIGQNREITYEAHIL